MRVIKSVLEEELQNSLRMKEEYEKALKKLPRGSLSKKIIKGRPYYYLSERKGSKVVSKYLGKISEKERNKFEKVKKLRKEYRHNLSIVKKQIAYLRSALRGKEAV
ncbi:MAG: hypothetical protein P9M00_12665 [Candidatus Tritonobacter lacicola]|nr:hypothetical protein [Candidatus Tritonobacter lacicola]